MMRFTPILIIFGVELFFAVSVLIGYEYGGKESSPIYIGYNLILFAITIAMLFNDMVIKKERYSRNQLYLLSIPLLITSIYLISIFFSLTNQLGTVRYSYFILWGLPSIYMGIYLSRRNQLGNSVKYLELIMLVFTVSVLIISIDALLNGSRVSIGGATYQFASYTAALSFGLNLYFLIYGGNHQRFAFTKSKIYKFTSILLLFVQLIGVFSSGGRGGMVLVLVYSLYILFSLLRNPIKLIWFSLLIITFLFAFNLVLDTLMEFTIFESSFNRVFSYVTNEGINWSSTSGRDDVYIEALNLIYNSPLFGYGIFGMWKVYGYYPHNLFLEILLQGGLVYLLLFLMLLLTMIKRLTLFIKVNPELRILTVMILYTLTTLMFSLTYLNNSIFWFSLSFIFSYNIKNDLQYKCN